MLGAQRPQPLWTRLTCEACRGLGTLGGEEVTEGRAAGEPSRLGTWEPESSGDVGEARRPGWGGGVLVGFGQ